MLMKEETLKSYLKTAAGILVTLLTLILAGRWYISTDNVQSFIEGVAGLFLTLLPTVAAIFYFYKEKSRWHELAVEVMSIAIVITLVVLIEPTNRDPGLGVGYKKLVIISLYLVIVTFATQWVKPEMISDDREKFLLKGIHAVTGVLVGIVTLMLTVHWYVYNTKGVAAVIVTLLLTGLTIVFFIDEDTGDLQVGIELLTILGVPALLMWARPDPSIDPDFGLFKKLIPAVLYLVVVAFACMFIESRELDKQDSTDEAEEDKAEEDKHKDKAEEDKAEEDTTQPEMADPGLLKKGDYFYHDGVKHEVLTDVDAEDGAKCSVSARSLRTGGKVILNFEPKDEVEMADKNSPVNLQ